MSDLAPFLQTLRDRLTITEVVRPHVKLTRKGKDSIGLCPFHKEKTPSFKVNDERGFYHCFGCGTHGDIFDFVMQKQNMPFMEAVELLAHLAGLEVPKSPVDPKTNPSLPKPDPSLYEVMEAACRWYEQQLSLTQGAPARAYLDQRGLLPETMRRFRLGYAPERGLQTALQKQGFSQDLMIQAGLMGVAEDRQETYDRFRGRLMFPIWDGKGRVIAFGGRILKEGEPKYLNSPDTPLFHKGKTLYAHNLALPVTRQGDPFIVVEGYMDVIALHQAGFPSAVAPLGTALTPEQMMLLWRGCAEPILCFDGDTAGTRAAHRAAQRALSVLKVGHTLRFCFLPTGEDPDSLLRAGRTDEWRQILSRPQPLVDVLWSIFMQGRIISTPEQKAMARRDVGYLIKELVDPDVRHFYRQELANRLQGVLEPNNHSYGGIQRRSLPIPSSPLKPGLALSTRSSPNKNHLGQKILLATLINHPTLIEEIAESLIVLGEMRGQYDELRQAIVEILTENHSLSPQDLQGLLKQKGFSSLLEELLTPQIYSLAPFAKESASLEEALIGWQEVWHRTVSKPHLTAETIRTAEAVRNQWDEQTWERFKFLKNQVEDFIFKKNE